MIGYLKGEVLEQTDGRVLLITGGVGYSVVVPQGPAYVNILPGSALELYVHTHVREDALDLFGFTSRGEKDLFLTLLSVNGIGPKVAMGLLGKIEPATLIHAVMNGDKDALTQIPGVGKKTAERMVLELADPIRKKVEAGVLGYPSGPTEKKRESRVTASVALLRDAKEALSGLGYREQEISAVLNQLLEDGGRPARAEDLVRSALQRLG